MDIQKQISKNKKKTSSPLPTNHHTTELVGFIFSSQQAPYKPPPPQLHPGTLEPATADDFAALFPRALIEQEMSTERYIDIPGEVLDVYKLWRPSPMFRARRLEKLLDTPAKIFYKYEGVSPAGSHKPNTAVP